MPNYLRGLPSRSKEYNRRQFVTRLSTAIDRAHAAPDPLAPSDERGSPLSRAEVEFAERRMPVAAHCECGHGVCTWPECNATQKVAA